MRKLFTFSALALSASLAACISDFPDIKRVAGETVFKGVAPETLDDTPGTVKSAVIYAPYRHKSGGDTIEEVSAGSIRDCFTQMFDAAAVNSGNYRVNCIGPKGDVVARFSLESQWMMRQSPRQEETNEIVRESWLEVETKRLPVTPSLSK